MLRRRAIFRFLCYPKLYRTARQQWGAEVYVLQDFRVDAQEVGVLVAHVRASPAEVEHLPRRAGPNCLGFHKT